jgi:molybdopterin-guanine dinucleotide biosynthesis protein
MTQILAIAGEKQSGKTSAVNFLHGYTLKETDPDKKFEYSIKDTGELGVSVVDSEGNVSEGS